MAGWLRGAIDALSGFVWVAASGGFVFFFSSRRRHTRFDCDWSSDVCSSDLSRRGFHLCQPGRDVLRRAGRHDQRSEERRVGKSVDLGGRRIIKKKKMIWRLIDLHTSTVQQSPIADVNHLTSDCKGLFVSILV